MSGEKRIMLEKLKKDIDELERTANKNLNEDKTKVEVDEILLKGMSKMGIEKLGKVPGKKGYRYITMKNSDLFPALKLVEDEPTRKKLKLA